MMVMTFMLAMLFMVKDEGNWMYKVGGTAIAFNLFLLFGGICGDPGVKSQTYLHYTKNWYSGGKDLFKEGEDSSEENTSNSDIENSAGGPSNRKIRQQKFE